MKKAFTLIELLVVIGIMGLLGTVSVGGYRAMQRGMAERGVMDNVNAFIRAAYQRAQIDRQPTAVYFWNETLRNADDDNTEIVIGKAVAIRRYGRITKVDTGSKLLYDEFADLELSYQTDDNAGTGSGESAAGEGSGETKQNTMYLYPIDQLTEIEDTKTLCRSIVYQKVFGKELTLMYLSQENGVMSDEADNGLLKTYAFKLASEGGSGTSNFQDWQPGMAYGFEFAHLELPHGFIFESERSTSVSDPVRTAGTMVFGIGKNAGNGVENARVSRETITVYQLRPDTTGELKPYRVAGSKDPREEM